MSLILDQSQANAVHSAMCALKNAGGYCCTLTVGRPDAIVDGHEDGRVVVFGDDIERYADLAAFATAYGLNAGA